MELEVLCPSHPPQQSAECRQSTDRIERPARQVLDHQGPGPVSPNPEPEGFLDAPQSS